MGPMGQLESWSQDQHGRYVALFGSNPVDGGGMRALSAFAHQVGDRVHDTRTEVVALQFSSAVSAPYAATTALDRTVFTGAADALNVWGSVTDESRSINIDGASAVSANARREAAAVSAVPDPESPAGRLQVLSLINDHQSRAVDIVERAAAAAQAAGARAAAAGNDDPRVQAVDHRSLKEQPPPPPPDPPIEGLPPEGLRPPVGGPVTEGPASRPSARDRGGRSLYDQDGGEWRYYPGDEWRHNPHWDYKPSPGPGSKWENIGIDGNPYLHNPVVTDLPPWLLAPNQSPPPIAAGPPQNPLLAPFPGMTMPPLPEAPGSAPDSGVLPHVGAPSVDAPPIGPAEVVVGIGAALLYLLLHGLTPPAQGAPS